MKAGCSPFLQVWPYNIGRKHFILDMCGRHAVASSSPEDEGLTPDLKVRRR